LKKFAFLFFIAALSIISLVGMANAETQKTDANNAYFTDISGHWAEEAINKAVKAGYVGGYPDGTFKPDQEVSRAEFTKMLTTALGLKSVSGASGAWYQEAVNAATEAGIYADDFKTGTWDTKMPRKEMMLLSVRAAITGYKQEYDMNRNLYEGAKAGLIMGTSPGNIDPDGTTTRAQAVVVIERVLAVKRGETLPSDKYAVSAAEILWHKTNIFTALPRYFNGDPSGFRSDLMKVQSPNGKVVCETEALVVVNLSDPKDPFRKYIPDNARWGEWANGGMVNHKLGNEGYAILSLNRMVIEEMPAGFNSLLRCGVSVSNEDLSDLPRNVQLGKVDGIYPIYQIDEKTDTVSSMIRPEANGKADVKYVTGRIIPNGDFSSDKKFRAVMIGLGDWNQNDSNLYSSSIDEKYHQ